VKFSKIEKGQKYVKSTAQQTKRPKDPNASYEAE